MSYYFMASIRIDDVREYQKYLDRSGEIFARYNGEYLVVDNDSSVLEGSWNYDRAILIRFPKKEDFEAWYTSDDYQEILTYRLSASTCDTLLLKGDQ